MTEGFTPVTAEEEKVIPFPTSEEEVGETNEEVSEESTEKEMDPIDEQPIDKKSYEGMIRQIGEMIKIMEQAWLSTKNEFKLGDSHMKLLYQFNESHRTEMPDNLTPEEQENWDHFNGLDQMTEDDVLEIFKEDHPIIGVTHEQTMDRIKDSVNEFFAYLSALKEYRQVNDAYLMLVEEEEEKNITQLKAAFEAETDPEKKAMMEESLRLYNERKYISFVCDITDDDVDRLASAFCDEEKITYWLNRGQDKLKQLKVSSKFILEISQFEKRFMDEKYHKYSNMILLYALNLMVYGDCTNKSKSNHDRNRIICLIMALDKIVQARATSEFRAAVLENLGIFLDKFEGKINFDKSVNTKYEHLEDVVKVDDNQGYGEEE